MTPVVHRNSGATTLEFALTAPVGIIVVFLFIEIGRMIMVQHAMTRAAYLGARKASLSSTANQSQVETHIRETLQSGSIASSLTNDANVLSISISQSGDFTQQLPGTDITVDLTVEARDVSWLKFFSHEFRLSASATARRE